MLSTSKLKCTRTGVIFTVKEHGHWSTIVSEDKTLMDSVKWGGGTVATCGEIYVGFSSGESYEILPER